MNNKRAGGMAAAGLLLLIVVASLWAGEQQAPPPPGKFGYASIGTADGELAEPDFFFSNEICATCHERQLQEFQGSMHSASHDESLYRHFAELAREEAGDEIYRYCSSCHAPAGVVSGLIPSPADTALPEAIKAGVTCDTCHQISALTGTEGHWGEPGNASFVIQQGRVKFGHSGDVAENRLHTGEKRDYFAKSEFCASCHTVIHPTNGFRIETSYEEWKKSVYAERGIQCQDCHMNTVEDAIEVARTLKPVRRQGQSAKDGRVRDIYPHYFVGGNANADRLAGGPAHAKMAEARLKSAAKIAIEAPASAAAGGQLRFKVAVENVAAGHDIPTGVSELRQMWVDLRVTDGDGNTLLASGQLDEHGEFGEDTIWFGAIAADAEGNKTYKLWEMTRFLWKRTVPAKATVREQAAVKLPASVAGPVTIDAKLYYRSAPPHVLVEVMGDDAFTPKITQMSAARVTVEVSGSR